MKIRIIGSTKEGYKLPIEEALEFGGKAAGICYMPDNFDAILNEDKEKTKKRVQRTLKAGHHSVYDHPTYNFLFEDIPKILAMVLNNEGFYTTSEKSARYTKMNPDGREELLYNKWIEILKNKIREVYPHIKEKQAEKLAQENARYMISVFTPTTMAYTVSLRQISIIISLMKRFIEEEPETDFNKKLKDCMKNFIEECREFDVPYLNSNIKNRKLALFDTRKSRRNEFGENYSVNYLGSFAQLAQAQRHRTLDYRIRIPQDDLKFYIPPIIRAGNNGGNNELENEWLKDIRSVSEVFPQGMLIEINERGTYENFILKAKERLCGSAQLEIALQTAKTLIEYIQALESYSKANESFCDASSLDNPTVYDEYCEIKNFLIQYVKKDANNNYVAVPRCRFPDWTCTEPCIWGARGLERLV
ncbi:MAG TPA: hypothetical protein GXX37_06515 [Clostridiaceae bacterium]|nr:hypothetical protein [Clostridiaceae bacterium]